MITAIDTNVLIDLFGADPIHGIHSKEAIRSCINQGSLVACEVVWAEVSAVFPSERCPGGFANFGSAIFPLRG